MLQPTLKYLLVLLLSLQAPLRLNGQTDSTRKNTMSFDLGITRGHNINLWPILKRYRNNEKKELQVLFPLFANRYSYLKQNRHFRLLPLYISDSSAAGINRRYLSLYYPSLLRIETRRDSAGASRSFHFLELAPQVSMLGINRSSGGVMLENNLFFFIWFKKDPSQERTSLVVFPAYWYFTNRYGSTQLLLPAYFYHRQDKNSYLNAGLLYNRWRSPKEHRQVLFPLWWQKTKLGPKDTVCSNLVLPLYWHRKSRSENSMVLFPLVFSYRHQQRSSFTLFPFCSFGSDSGKRYLAVTPVFWHTHSGEGSRNILFPLLWNKTSYMKTDTVRRNFVFPLFWHRKSRYENSTVLFPILYSYRRGQQHSLTFFPLYSQGSKDSLNSYLALTPLFWHIRSRQGTRNVFFPLFWDRTLYMAGDTIRKNTLFPIYWQVKSRYLNNRILFPLLFDLQNRARHSLTLFPLFSTGGDTSLHSHYMAITPFFWHERSPQQRRNILFPVYWNTQRYTLTDTMKKEVLFPLVWMARSKQHDHTVVVPLLFHFHNPGLESLTIFPLFHRSTDSLRNESRTAFTPLYWNIRTRHYRKNVLFPVYWNTEEYTGKDTIRRKVLFPVLWTMHTRSMHNTVVFPLVYHLRDSNYQSLTVFPLFSKGRSVSGNSRHLAITPLFWRVQKPHSATTLLLPVYWSHYHLNQRGDTLRFKGIFPIFWSSAGSRKNNYTVFPFVFSIHNDIRRSLTVFPFFSYDHRFDSSGGHLAITPLFWRIQRKNSHSTLLLPVYFRKKTYLANDTVCSTTLFPLVWSKTGRENSQFVFLPLVFSHRDIKEKSFTVLPLFSYGQRFDSSRRHLVITPLFWHLASRYGSRDVLFPFYWSKTVHLKDYELHRRVLFPIYWHREDNHVNNTVIFPLVYSFRQDQRYSFTFFPVFSYGKDPKNQSDHLVIAPLFWHIRNPYDTWNVLFPLYWQRTDRNTKDTTVSHVLFPLFWHSHNKNFTRNVLFPLYWQRTDRSTKDTAVRHFVFPLFWHSHNKHLTRNVLFPLYWYRTDRTLEDTTRSQVFLPLLWYKRGRHTANTVLFPLVYGNRYKGRSSFTFFPLFSFGKDTALHTSYLMATPLFWHYKNPKGSRNILFPLVWQSKGLHGDRRFVFFPLYWHVRQGPVQKDIFLPLVYRLSNAHYRSFTVLPLFTVGRSHDERKAHLLVTPLFGRFRQGDTTHTFLFPLFDREHSARQTSTKVLLFLFRRTTRPEGYARTSLLWPLCEWTRDGSSRRFYVAPLVWGHRSDSSRLLSVQPFFFSKSTPKKSTFILSAFLYKRDREFGVSVSNSFLFRAYYHKRYTNGDFEHRFLHVVVANVKVDGRREKSFLPFFHTIHEKNGDKSVSYLLGFYNRFREYKPEIKDVYEEERILWVIRLRSNYKQLKSEGKGNFVRKKQKRGT